MAQYKYKHKKPGMKLMGKAKTRNCLMCREPFMSEWSTVSSR